MGTAGYAASVQKSGTSTGFTGEATTNTSGNVWRLNDATKRVLDREVALVWYDNGVPIVAGDITSVDFLFGEVTFTGSKSGPITVDGSYMPMTEVAGANSFNLNRTSQVLDDSDTSNVGYHTKKTALLDASVSVSRWDDIQYTFTDLLEARIPMVIDIIPGNSHHYKGWFVVESDNKTFDVNALLGATTSFQLAGDDEIGKTFSHKVVS